MGDVYPSDKEGGNNDTPYQAGPYIELDRPCISSLPGIMIVAPYGVKTNCMPIR